GSALDARDVVSSIARASKAGAASFLARFGTPTVSPGDALSVVFPKGDRVAVARALASPLTAIVPRGFDPRKPDGTGAFSATLTGGSLLLARNLSAARGASFLESITVTKAPDLTTSLRDFEAQKDDLGWNGALRIASRRGRVRFR